MDLVFLLNAGREKKHMGKTTSKKMIPLLILRILWKHADKENMVIIFKSY